MANYKPKAIIKTGFGIEMEFNVPDKAKVKVLYFYFNGGTVAKTLLDVETNAVYKVPAGNIFYLCGVVHGLNGTGPHSMVLSLDSTVDTDGTLKYTVPVISTVQIINYWPVPDTPSWGINKYFTGYDALGLTSFVKVIGYELPN